MNKRLCSTYQAIQTRQPRPLIARAISTLTGKLPPWAGEAFRFLLGGVLNSVVGYGCYLLLLHWMRYELAYAIAYVVGIIVSYVFSARFVFRQPMQLKSALRYPIVYVVQFLLGLLILRVLIEILHVPVWLSPLLVSVITLPTTFFISRVIMRTK